MGTTTHTWGQLKDGPERKVEIRRAVTAQLPGIAHNTTSYVPRRLLAWTLEDLPQSDLYREYVRLTFFSWCSPALRTRRAGKEGQRRDDGVGGDDGVIRNLCAVLDDCEFPLRK